MLHHHFQHTPTTCGPAVARMLAERLGYDVPEGDLATLLGTDAQGTRPAALAHGLRALGFQVAESTGGRLQDVAAALRGGHVVVCYALPERGVDHYAILTAADSRTVSLCDPIYGPDVRWSACCFMERWLATTTTPSVPGGWWLSVEATRRR